VARESSARASRRACEPLGPGRSGYGVAAFLTGALDLANAEDGTPVWFALRTDDVTFWIVDAFPGDTERQAHINGEIAKALMANAERLLAQPPDLGMADVLAAKVTT
jgi:hypothetical protein